MKSFIDNIRANYISGWCFNEEEPDVAQTVELYVNSIKIAEKIANLHRLKIFDKGLHPTGNVGFLFRIDSDILDENSVIEMQVHSNDKRYILHLGQAYVRFRKSIFFLKLKREVNIQKKTHCIVHIGMHKTGSSSLQVNLMKNKNNINFSYFNLGIANHSVPLFTLFSETQKGNLYVDRMDWDSKQIEEYKVNIDAMFRKHLSLNSNHETFVLSGEGMGLLTKNELLYLKEYLLTFFEKLSIVAYVRSPISYINSMFQESVKMSKADFSLLHKYYPSYKNHFHKFDLVFGEKNVYLYKFSKEDLSGGDVTLDFLEKNHLVTKNTFFSQINESLSLEAISFLYIYYKFGKGYGKGERNRIENNNLVKSLEHLGSRKLQIGKSTLKTFIDNNMTDIKWIEDRIGRDILDEKNYSVNNSAVNSEQDLIKIAKESIIDLKHYIGNNFLIEHIKADSIEDIIDLIDVLKIVKNKD